MIAPPILFVLSVGLIVTGPLLWTSGWWWPRFKRLIRRDADKRQGQLEAEKAHHEFRHTSEGVQGTILGARQNEIEQRLERLENKTTNHGRGEFFGSATVKKRRSPEVEELHALVPLIKRQIKARKPNKPLATSVWSIALWTMPSETRADYLELLAKMDALGIGHPEGNAGREEWFVFLVELEFFARTGDLPKARALYSEDDPYG